MGGGRVRGRGLNKRVHVKVIKKEAQVKSILVSQELLSKGSLGLAELGDRDLQPEGRAQAWPGEGWLSGSCRAPGLALRLLLQVFWARLCSWPTAQRLPGQQGPVWLNPTSLALCRFLKERTPAPGLPDKQLP